MADARLAALTFLEKCRRSNAWSDAVLGSVMDSAELDGRDRGLCTAICYGTMQNMRLLDNAVSAFSSVKVNKLEPKVLDILRISAYQLLFMDRIPPSAAVNEAVKLSKKLGYARASGLVNAVLRKISSNKETLLNPKGRDKVDTLSLKYSHPRHLGEYFISVLGEEETEELLKCHNGEVPIAIQVNTLKTTTAELTETLTQAGIQVHPHSWMADCLVLSGTGSLEKLAAFQEGLFYVQDAAAKLCVSCARIPQGAEIRVLDCCSAPGGKSFAAVIAIGGDLGNSV